MIPPATPQTAPAPSDPAPDLGRRERRKLELRSRMYSTARQLFLERGFDNTTVDAIAAAADVAPATFFNHFESKQALLGLMTDEVVTHIEGLIAEHFAGPGSARERFCGFARHAAEMIGANKPLARPVMLELMRAQAKPEEATPYLEAVHPPVESLLREARETGEVRVDQDVAFLAQMVVGMLNATVSSWLADSRYPVERELPRAAEFAWDAIRPRDASE